MRWQRDLQDRKVKSRKPKYDNKKLVSYVPEGLSLSTDIIKGNPGESRAQTPSHEGSEYRAG